jgi:hypothetical protein
MKSKQKESIIERDNQILLKKLIDISQGKRSTLPKPKSRYTSRMRASNGRFTLQSNGSRLVLGENQYRTVDAGSQHVKEVDGLDPSLGENKSLERLSEKLLDQKPAHRASH